MDGIDFPINEPSPFSSQWFSHKFHGAGLRYEIGIRVRSARIVWASGPYAAGAHSDVSIFRNDLKNRLAPFEFVIADSGYSDVRCIQPPGKSHPDHSILAKIRAGHGTANRRLKQFSVLRLKFMHNLNRHLDCFCAVLNITALMLDEEPLLHSEQ